MADKTFFLTRPDFDDGTFYMHEWSEQLISKARAKGYNIIDVDGKNVTKEGVVGRLRVVKPKLVCLNGHGNENEYAGHDFKPVITLNSTDSLKGTTVFVRACNCLEGLGSKAVKDGCNAFVGYSVEFLIPIHDQYTATPLNDPVAFPVMTASNEVMEKLIDGKTPQEAVAASKKLSRELVRKLMYSPKYSRDLQYGYAVFALVNNSSGLGFKQ